MSDSNQISGEAEARVRTERALGEISAQMKSLWQDSHDVRLCVDVLDQVYLDVLDHWFTHKFLTGIEVEGYSPELMGQFKRPYCFDVIKSDYAEREDFFFLDDLEDVDEAAERFLCYIDDHYQGLSLVAADQRAPAEDHYQKYIEQFSQDIYNIVDQKSLDSSAFLYVIHAAYLNVACDHLESVFMRQNMPFDRDFMQDYAEYIVFSERELYEADFWSAKDDHAIIAGYQEYIRSLPPKSRLSLVPS